MQDDPGILAQLARQTVVAPIKLLPDAESCQVDIQLVELDYRTAGA